MTETNTDLTEESGRNINPVLAAGLLTFDKLPEHYSFRCIIVFEEFSTNGVGSNHMSTGYWWHRNKAFSVDDKEMEHFTPWRFIPIYDSF